MTVGVPSINGRHMIPGSAEMHEDGTQYRHRP